MKTRVLLYFIVNIIISNAFSNALTTNTSRSSVSDDCKLPDSQNNKILSVIDLLGSLNIYLKDNNHFIKLPFLYFYVSTYLTCNPFPVGYEKIAEILTSFSDIVLKEWNLIQNFIHVRTNSWIENFQIIKQRKHTNPYQKNSFKTKKKVLTNSGIFFYRRSILATILVAISAATIAGCLSFLIASMVTARRITIQPPSFLNHHHHEQQQQENNGLDMPISPFPAGTYPLVTSAC